MKTIKLLSLILASFILFIYACDDNDGTAKFNLHLIDATGDYAEVLIHITGAEVHFETEDGEGQWKTLNVDDRIYDLLKLTNGEEVLLASEDLPAGTISQIRLILGEGNSVVIEGEEVDAEGEPITEEFDLTTPSAQTSGLKLNIHAQLEAGLTYDLTLDFNVDKSIVKTGSGKYNLKPVIRTYTKATSGAIEGFVTPFDSETSVSIIVNGDVISTLINEKTGYFMLSGIPEDNYDVLFTPGDLNAYLEQTVNVVVSVGVITEIEPVELEAVSP